MNARKALQHPFPVIFALSVLALAAALASQFIGGLEPCIMCLYQRMPFMAAAALSMLGMALHKNPKATTTLLVLCALAFLVNTGLAFYHSGIELQWWDSAVEGCKVPTATGDTNWIDKILTNPAVPCTVIQWKDPVLGLTMANYNIALNIALFAFCVFSFVVPRDRGKSGGK